MSKTFGQQAAEILAAIEEADKTGKVSFRVTEKADEQIVVTIPAFLENSTDFVKTFLDLGHFTSGIFNTKKSKRQNVKNKLAYISYITNNSIDSYTKEELKKLMNDTDQDSTKISDVAPFIFHLLLVWNSLHPKLRQTRKLNEKIVGGYLKQRATYSHREILDMVETYGKWAEVYFAMVEADDFKPIWFHNTSLQGLLTSNKLFPNHLEGGWKQLRMDKGISKDYIVDQEPLIKEKTPEQEAKDDTRKIRQAARAFVDGQGNIWPEFYAKHQTAVDAMIPIIEQELKDAS